MDSLLNPHFLQEFLKKNNLPPLDRFGQHFLIDEGVLEQIVDTIDPKPDVPVIEIGAGLGQLSRAMANHRQDSIEEKLEPIYAVELDKRLINPLRQNTKLLPSIKVIHSDILKLDISSFAFPVSRYLVCGNIPYNITSKLLRHVLSWDPKPEKIVFLVDFEVAKRVTANPPEMSILSVSVQNFAEAEIVGPVVPPESFIPAPKIKSAVLRLTPRKEPLVPREMEKEFFKLVRAGFSQKRKTLQNSLRALWQCSGEEAARRLQKSGIDPQRRPQTLTIEEWRRLLNC